MLKQIITKFNTEFDKQKYSIKTEKDYQIAIKRFEEIKKSVKGNPKHKEKLLLALLINKYEETLWNISDLNSIELLEIRKNDFGYNSKK